MTYLNQRLQVLQACFECVRMPGVIEHESWEAPTTGRTFSWDRVSDRLSVVFQTSFYVPAASL